MADMWWMDHRNPLESTQTEHERVADTSTRISDQEWTALAAEWTIDW